MSSNLKRNAEPNLKLSLKAKICEKISVLTPNPMIVFQVQQQSIFLPYKLNFPPPLLSLSHLHCLFHSLVFHPLQSRDDGWHQFGTPLYLTWWSRGWAGQDHVGAKDHSNPMCCRNCLLSSTWLSPLILPLWKQFTFSCSLILPEAFMCLWCLHPLEVEKHWSESSYEGDLFPQIFINNGWK